MQIRLIAAIAMTSALMSGTANAAVIYNIKSVAAAFEFEFTTTEFVTSTTRVPAGQFSKCADNNYSTISCLYADLSPNFSAPDFVQLRYNSPTSAIIRSFEFQNGAFASFGVYTGTALGSPTSVVMTVTQAPEPAVAGLFALGALAMGWRRRRAR